MTTITDFDESCLISSASLMVGLCTCTCILGSCAASGADGDISFPKRVNGAKNGAERAENLTEVIGFGARAGNRRNRNGAANGLNPPLKIRSTVKPLMQKA